jgi:hypothetical protein
MKNRYSLSALKCLITSLLLSGCGWPQWDLSEKEPLKSYVGITGTLKRPMTLLEQRKYVYSFVPHTIDGPGEVGDSGAVGGSVDWHVVCSLPVGTEIKTTSVKMEARDGGRVIYVIGLVKSPSTEEWVDFEIWLGGPHGEKQLWLRRMPWESDDIPENLYIKLKKRLLLSDYLL